MITMRPLELGELALYLNTLVCTRGYFYILGYNNARKQVRLTMDRFYYPNDIALEYGYAHIVAYTIGESTGKCDIYCSIG